MRFLVLPGDVRRNFGDTAIALGVLALIREVDPAAEIRIAGPPPLLPGGFEGVPFVPGNPAILAAARKADLVVWGGGQLLAGNRSRAKVPLWAVRIEAIHALGARIVGIGQGVGPLPAASDLRWTARAVARTVGFTVRDEESARLLRAAGVPDARFRVAADPAMLLAPREGIVAAPRPPPALGLSPRWTGHHRAGRMIPFRFLPAAVRRRSFTSPAARAFEAAWIALADRLADRLAVELRLAPTYRAGWEADEPLCDAIVRGVHHPERARTLRPRHALAELLDELAGLEFFVGMPMHATILATTCGVPAVTLPYEPKGTEFARALGIPEMIGPALAGPADVDGVAAAVEAAWADRERRRAALPERVAALRARAMESAEVLRRALEGGR